MSVDAALLGVALEIAGEFAASAIATPEGVTWNGPRVIGMNGDEAVIGHGPVGSSLYDGTAGIALMLAAASEAAAGQGAPGAAELRRTALEAARDALAGGRKALTSGQFGLFDGAAGAALSVATVGRVLDEPELRAASGLLSAGLLGRLAGLADRRLAGTEVDLISGVAGAVLGVFGTRTALLADRAEVVESLAGDDSKTLLAVGHRLAEAAVRQTWGSAWPTVAGGPADAPLLGLGHGAAGISLALAELAALTGDDAVREAAEQGLEYERGWYDADRVGWPDLRPPRVSAGPGQPGQQVPPSQLGLMNAWCHGAIGIGMSRARMISLADQAGPSVLGLELSAALQAVRDLVVGAGTALRAGVRTDCTPCHGLAGAVELLLAAETALGAPEHGRAARGVAALIGEQGAGGTWPCGLRGQGEVRGLMTGRAGLALTLLRVAGFRAVASPLLPGSLAG